MNNVLVLNGGVPYQIYSLQHAIRRFLEGKVRIVEEIQDFPLRNGNGVEVMKCPSVVMLNSYVDYHPEPKYSRENIFYRDEYHCQYCNKYIENSKEREIDHIIPRASPNFPGNTFENVVLVCSVCNRQKGSNSLKEMNRQVCWNGRPFRLVKIPEAPKNKIGYSRFILSVNSNNIIWLRYIPKWEVYAKKLKKEWLFDAYEKLINGEKNEIA